MLIIYYFNYRFININMNIKYNSCVFFSFDYFKEFSIEIMRVFTFLIENINFLCSYIEIL